MPPAPANKGKKNPAKDPGTASVNQVGEDKESTDSEGNDTDALSHLPTDEESGDEDQGLVKQMGIQRSNDNHPRRSNLQKIKF